MVDIRRRETQKGIAQESAYAKRLEELDVELPEAEEVKGRPASERLTAAFQSLAKTATLVAKEYHKGKIADAQLGAMASFGKKINAFKDMTPDQQQKEDREEYFKDIKTKFESDLKNVPDELKNKAIFNFEKEYLRQKNNLLSIRLTTGRKEANNRFKDGVKAAQVTVKMHPNYVLSPEAGGGRSPASNFWKTLTEVENNTIPLVFRNDPERGKRISREAVAAAALESAVEKGDFRTVRDYLGREHKHLSETFMLNAQMSFKAASDNHAKQTISAGYNIRNSQDAISFAHEAVKGSNESLATFVDNITQKIQKFTEQGQKVTTTEADIEKLVEGITEDKNIGLTKTNAKTIAKNIYRHAESDPGGFYEQRTGNKYNAIPLEIRDKDDNIIGGRRAIGAVTTGEQRLKAYNALRNGNEADIKAVMAASGGQRHEVVKEAIAFAKAQAKPGNKTEQDEIDIAVSLDAITLNKGLRPDLISKARRLLTEKGAYGLKETLPSEDNAVYEKKVSDRYKNDFKGIQLIVQLLARDHSDTHGTTMENKEKEFQTAYTQFMSMISSNIESSAPSADKSLYRFVATGGALTLTDYEEKSLNEKEKANIRFMSNELSAEHILDDRGNIPKGHELIHPADKATMSRVQDLNTEIRQGKDGFYYIYYSGFGVKTTPVRTGSGEKLRFSWIDLTNANIPLKREERKPEAQVERAQARAKERESFRETKKRTKSIKDITIDMVRFARENYPMDEENE